MPGPRKGRAFASRIKKRPKGARWRKRAAENHAGDFILRHMEIEVGVGSPEALLLEPVDDNVPIEAADTSKKDAKIETEAADLCLPAEEENFMIADPCHITTNPEPTDLGSFDINEQYVELDSINQQNSALEDHLYGITLEDPGKPHRCNVCRKGFTTRSHLVVHTRTHTGEKPFGCEQCRARFAQHSNLKKHVSRHRQKPLQCPHCDKTFSMKKSMRLHERMHTGQMPYGCRICGRAFAQRSHLTAHLFMHTGEQPFVCTECNKRFNHRSNLNAHLKLHSR